MTSGHCVAIIKYLTYCLWISICENKVNKKLSHVMLCVS